MPKQYKCRGKDCFYETDDLGDYIAHSLDERIKPVAEELRQMREVQKKAETEPAPPKVHTTVKDYLECPECYPKFEKAMLENSKFQEKLKQEGYEKRGVKR